MRNRIKEEVRRRREEEGIPLYLPIPEPPRPLEKPPEENSEKRGVLIISIYGDEEEA